MNNNDQIFGHRRRKPREDQRNGDSLSIEMTENSSNCKPCSRHKTVTSEEVELIIREPYILAGYRLPKQPWRYYFASVCWLHNETGNVWTHLIGCVLLVVHAIVLGLRLDNFQDPRAGLMLAFALSCFVSNLFSSLAHLLHSKSAKHHYILYFLDYAGISVYNYGNGIDALHSCASAEQYLAVKKFFLIVLVAMCFASFVVILIARLKFQGPEYDRRRKIIMTGIYLVLMIFISWPIIGRYVACIRDTDCSVGSLTHITLIFVSYFFVGASFTALLPEKLRPGMFDIWGHSHQWFHVFVMATQQLQLYALHVDYVERGRARHVTTTFPILLLALGILIVAEVVVIRLMIPSVERKVAEGLRRVNTGTGSLLMNTSANGTGGETPVESDD